MNNKKIALTLSGGGFRASFFHLGVIRRLEELGLMEEVEVISSVSGGSIIGAYYLCEFEKQERSGQYSNRIDICDKIIEKFYLAVLKNLRMRALIFSPFFHPFLFMKSIVGWRTRSEIMAREFERHFYSSNLTIGDLPNNPKILINTTSNATGERMVYYKQGTESYNAQISKKDFNNISLSKVVMASAAVPGLFPPVSIADNLLSDGGVIDNQGLESIFDCWSISIPSLNRINEDHRNPPEGDDELIILCSDASGQIKVDDTPAKSGRASALRSMDILQAANRSKVLIRLQELKDSERIKEFAFIHLSMNLKDRKIDGRLRSEFIRPVANIRTDLDEFDLIEAYSLMYHGYTLINAQIDRWCPGLKDTFKLDNRLNKFDNWSPAFLKRANLTTKGSLNELSGEEKRRFIVNRLDIGRERLFRNIRKEWTIFIKYLFISFAPFIVSLLPGIRSFIFSKTIGSLLSDRIAHRFAEMIPFVGKWFESENRYSDVPVFMSDMIILCFLFYTCLWIYWVLNRKRARDIYKEDFIKASPSGTELPITISPVSIKRLFFAMFYKEE